VAFVPEKSVKRWQVDDAAKVDLPAPQMGTASALTAFETPLEPQLGALPESKRESLPESQPHANVASAEKKTPLATFAEPQAQSQAETAPETALADEEAELNLALIAEQQVILSQAQSQGFAASVDAVSSANTALNQPTHPIATHNTANTSLDAPTVALAEHTVAGSVLSTPNGGGDLAPEAYVADAYGQHDDAQTSDAQTRYAQAYASSAPLDAYQDDYVRFMSEDAGPQVIASDSNALSNHSAQLVAPSQPVEQRQEEPQALAAENIHRATTAVSLEEDDILLAVLAARESLLSDLDALSTKEGDGKKLSPDVKLKTSGPSAQSSLATRATERLSPAPNAVTAECESDFELPFDDDVEGEAMIEKKPELSTNATNGPLAPQNERATNHTPVTTMHSAQQSAAAQHPPLDSNDRPPWEDAPAAESRYGHAAPITTSPQASEANHPRPESPAPRAPLLAETAAQTAPAPTLPTDPQAAQVEQAAGQTHQLNHPDEVRAIQPLDLAAGSSPAQSTALTAAQSITGHPLDLHWYKLMASLEIGGRVRQLAVNSICQVQANPLPLLLKPDQKHLAAQVAIEQLEQALSAAFGNPRQVTVVIGTDPNRETPLELRKRFHQELLQQARQSLITDDNVQWLINRFGAELEQDSLLYPPELLNQRSGLITALPEPE
ncbi:MAG: DNA polymerase III subunit gamma/tau C-terminal domain-containing protein, partial [Shewanella sp.]